MTEMQYITLVLGFVANIVTVLIALLINNGRFNDQGNRLTDLKETLRAEIKAEVSSSQQAVVSHLVDIIGKIAELDNRITRLER